MIKAQSVNLGARIPADLKKRVSDYCDRNGVKLQFFITEAIQEKLEETMQDDFDKRVVNERLANPKFTSLEELQKYTLARKKHR